MSDNPTGLPNGEPILVLQLGTPIIAFGNTLTELRFMRRPKARDSVYLQKNGLEDAEATLHSVRLLTGVPYADLLEMDGHDFYKAQGVISGFLQAGPPTGRSGLQSSGESSAPA